MSIDLADPDAIAPGGALEDGYGLFAFESDFASDLRCIPMVVRFKLDRAGIKLSLRQWTRIGQSNRQALAAIPCNTLHEVAVYRRTLVGMVERNTPEHIVGLPLNAPLSWADPARMPNEVAAQALIAGVNPPTDAQWSNLDTLQRFALVKLARSNHDNHNFAPALREFGIGGFERTSALL